MSTSQKSSLNKNNATQPNEDKTKMIPFLTKTFVTLTLLNAILLILSISSCCCSNCVWTEAVFFGLVLCFFLSLNR